VYRELRGILASDSSSAQTFLEASFCERFALSRLAIWRWPADSQHAS